jgi:hypothetical protein
MSDAREAVLRKALDQFVENLAMHVDAQGEDVTDAERAELATAEALLDEMNAAMLRRLGV